MVITLPELPVVYHTEHFTVRNVVASTFDCLSFCMALFFQNPSAILWSFSISSLTEKLWHCIFQDYVSRRRSYWNFMQMKFAQKVQLFRRMIDWLIIIISCRLEKGDGCMLRSANWRNYGEFKFSHPFDADVGCCLSGKDTLGNTRKFIESKFHMILCIHSYFHDNIKFW